MTRDKNISKKGFTVIELVLVMAVASVIALILSSFFSLSLGSLSRADNTVKAQSIVRKLGIQVDQDLRKGLMGKVPENIDNKYVINNIVYKFDPQEKTLTRDGAEFVQNIDSFEITGSSTRSDGQDNLVIVKANINVNDMKEDLEIKHFMRGELVVEDDNAIKEWVKPVDAHDAYKVGDIVTYNGKTWVNNRAGNLYAPGVLGWEVK